MDNLLNRIGRAAVVTILAALSFFSAELAGILPDVMGVAQVVLSAAIGAISLLVEYLRDQWDIQRLGTSGHRTQAFIRAVTFSSRFNRGLLVAAVAFLVTLGSEWANLLPDLEPVIQILMSTVLGGISLLVEYLRDYFDLETTRR